MGLTQQQASQLVKGQHIRVLYKGPQYLMTKQELQSKKGRWCDALVNDTRKSYYNEITDIYVYLYPLETEHEVTSHYGSHELIPIENCKLPNNVDTKLDQISRILGNE